MSLVTPKLSTANLVKTPVNDKSYIQIVYPEPNI